mmetsp:Transcript_5307/g.8178  ORF Transcript_5307/g.8178 Transcript_5307/m.8178 type:complete len:204 (-) Transcript_5307:215-826(-)
MNTITGNFEPRVSGVKTFSWRQSSVWGKPSVPTSVPFRISSVGRKSRSLGIDFGPDNAPPKKLVSDTAGSTCGQHGPPTTLKTVEGDCVSSASSACSNRFATPYRTPMKTPTFPLPFLPYNVVPFDIFKAHSDGRHASMNASPVTTYTTHSSLSTVQVAPAASSCLNIVRCPNLHVPSKTWTFSPSTVACTLPLTKINISDPS